MLMFIMESVDSKSHMMQLREELAERDDTIDALRRELETVQQRNDSLTEEKFRAIYRGSGEYCKNDHRDDNYSPIGEYLSQ